MKGDDDLLDKSYTYNVAYFSAQPPSAPLRLVPFACTDSQVRYDGTGSQVTGVVESMLHDLITGLPVTPRLKRRTELHDAFRPVHTSLYVPPSVTVNLKSATHNCSRRSSALAVEDDRKLRCSVATQAHTNHRSVISEMSVLTPATDRRWVGEVRDPRDCHMQLVLRQLRHIVHLNRAVDRAVYPLLMYAGKI